MPTKPSQDVIRLADTILYDLRGPGYYRDPEILSGLIRHRLGSRVSEPQARQIAEAVNAAFQERADLDQSALEGLLVEQGLA